MSKLDENNAAKETILTVVRFLDKQVAVEKEKIIRDEKIKTAASLNHLLKQAEKNKWSKQYINAIHDIKKVLKIKNTVYDLYV